MADREKYSAERLLPHDSGDRFPAKTGRVAVGLLAAVEPAHGEAESRRVSCAFRQDETDDEYPQTAELTAIIPIRLLFLLCGAAFVCRRELLQPVLRRRNQTDRSTAGCHFEPVSNEYMLSIQICFARELLFLFPSISELCER